MRVCGGVIIALCLECLRLPPSLTLLFTLSWWHALFLTDSSGQPRSYTVSPLNVFIKKKEKKGSWIFFCCCFLLVSAKKCRHGICIFCKHLVRWGMVTQRAVSVPFLFLCCHRFPLFCRFDRSVFTVDPRFTFQPLTKANDRLGRNDIRVVATCPCRNA